MEIKKELIFLEKEFDDKKQVFEFIKQKLIEFNLGNEETINSMIKRDEKASVAIGSYLAITHCEYEYGKNIKINEFIFIKLKKPIFWDENEVLFVIVLILNSDKQIDMLYDLAISFSDEEKVKKFYKQCKSIDDVNNFLKPE
ncbi:hypothetical protein SLITO_v1c05570 [Spiroplasma litorale]|uniref:PTS EIIA type-2 domain-containing protein n=1 Tax=Spiroplasma litorale TaxID=216942 RepID=A0A0K1W1J6_9MOLU|nr:PTS sugar transporter subunit IIA [Spiroplasma litorale]AKX34195.1 hypothetical protein SLITO_v1c05570 [Spiroplasma litorale]